MNPTKRASAFGCFRERARPAAPARRRSAPWRRRIIFVQILVPIKFGGDEPAPARSRAIVNNQTAMIQDSAPAPQRLRADAGLPDFPAQSWRPLRGNQRDAAARAATQSPPPSI